jgi:hypothetical protein
MRSVCIVAAVIVVAASPALAQSARKAQAQRSPQATSDYGYDGQKRYSDPDPNVRFEMMRQENWRKGG